MRIVNWFMLGGILLAGLAGQSTVAHAAPFPVAGGSDGFISSDHGLLHKASGCHHYRQYHYVKKKRHPMWHKHLSDCAAVPARPPINRGIIYRDGLGYYCHPEWRKHRHPTFGKTWHRHAGRHCVVSPGWGRKGAPRARCRRIGGSWVCK